jgi:SAM-dependent methyltransferase
MRTVATNDSARLLNVNAMGERAAALGENTTAGHAVFAKLWRGVRKTRRVSVKKGNRRVFCFPSTTRRVSAVRRVLAMKPFYLSTSHLSAIRFVSFLLVLPLKLELLFVYKMGVMHSHASPTRDSVATCGRWPCVQRGVWLLDVQWRSHRCQQDMSDSGDRMQVSWLHLHALGLYRDLRKLIYIRLNKFDFAVVEAAHFSSRPVKLDEAFARLCAEQGHLTLLKWARENRCPWNEWTCALAAENGHVQVLQWARENGCPWNGSTCSSAARGGHLCELQWARENRCPWSEETCARAAANGHLHVLQWARENGCPWDKQTCAWAAFNGHLEVLQWARENGCSWNWQTCAWAAISGHLQVLQWARENGCPWDEETCLAAAGNEHLRVLQWARENGCPWDKRTCENAAANGHLQVLQWAREHGCPE